MLLMEKFLLKVEKTDSCWIWKGAKNFSGYGHMKINGHCVPAHRIAYTLFKGDIPNGLYVMHSCDNPPCVNPEHLSVGTHSDNMKDKVRKGRWRGGELPTEMWSEIHKDRWSRISDEKKAEIFVKIAEAQKGREFSEDHLTNLRAAHFARRGKSPKLTKPLPQTKLTPDQVMEIRTSYGAGESCGSIAKRYGLSVKCIYNAAVGKNHKQLDGAVGAARFGTDEWRENISKANKNRKFSPEHLANLRAALKLRDERRATSWKFGLAASFETKRTSSNTL